MTTSPTREPIFFPSAAAFGDWLAAHHATATECVVGFWKVGTGQPSLTWSEAVDEAICWGWIDGRGNRIDDERYMIRFTPRKPASIWSAVNMKKVEALSAASRMRPPGVAAWEARREDRSGVYSFEQESVEWEPEFAAELAAHPDALAHFDAQPKSYRRAVIWWVQSAKREETKARRMASLIAESTAGHRLRQFTSPGR